MIQVENTPSRRPSHDSQQSSDSGSDPREYDNYPMAAIMKPGPNDVLCGRGGGTNNHSGNIRFRKLVNEHKIRYLAATKVEKPKVAKEVVQLWRKMNPPGRFLARTDGKSSNGTGATPKDEESIWADVGDKKAREKASQCLRERTPDVLPFVKQMQSEQAQQSPQQSARPAILIRSKTAPAEVGPNPGAVDSFFPQSPPALGPERSLLGHLQVHEKLARSHSSLDVGRSPFQMQEPRHPGQHIIPSALHSSISGNFPPPPPISFPHQQEMPPPPPPGGWAFQQPVQDTSSFDPFRDPCRTVQEGNEDDDVHSDGELTLEEYQKSLEEYMAKELPFDADAPSKSDNRRQIMEGMRRNSWIKSFHSIDTLSISMTSQANSKRNPNQPLEEDACSPSKMDPKQKFSMSTATLPMGNRTHAFPCSTTSNMALTSNGYPSRPSLPNKHDPHLSRSQKMKFSKAKSEVSMFSDMSDPSFNPSKSLRSMKRRDSGFSMMSELTDLSESMSAMTMELSATAAFKA